MELSRCAAKAAVLKADRERFRTASVAAHPANQASVTAYIAKEASVAVYLAREASLTTFGSESRIMNHSTSNLSRSFFNHPQQLVKVAVLNASKES